jgi:hypothetical protein
VDPSTLGLYVAALSPVLGALGVAGRWFVLLMVTVWRESIAARRFVAELQRADNQRMVDALLASARADDAHRAAVNDLLEEVREAAAWKQGTVYRPKPSGDGGRSGDS